MNINKHKKTGIVEQALIDEYLSEHKIFKGHCKNNSPNQNLCVIINETLKICSENFEIENNLDNLNDKIVNNSENLSNTTNSGWRNL